MIRTLSTALIALSALAGAAAPAAALDVRVSLVGKDMAAIRTDIRKAASTVCRDALRGSTGGVATLGGCIAQVSAEPLALAKAAKEAQLAASTRPAPLAVTRVSTDR